MAYYGSDWRRGRGDGGNRDSGERWRGGNRGRWDAGSTSEESSWRHNTESGSGSWSERAGGRRGYDGVSYRGRRGRGGEIGHGERGRGSYGNLGRRGNSSGVHGRGGWAGEASWVGESGPSTIPSSSGCGRVAASGLHPSLSSYSSGGAGVIARGAAAEGGNGSGGREIGAAPSSAWSQGTIRSLGKEAQESGTGSGGRGAKRWETSSSRGNAVPETSAIRISERPSGREEGSSVDLVAEKLSLLEVNTAGFASKSVLTLAVRPDAGGTKGRKIRVTANYFQMYVDTEEIHLYSVEIRRCASRGDGDVVSRSTRRAVEQRLLEDCSSDLGGRFPVFDGSNLLYSAKALPFEARSFTISVRRTASDRPQDFVLQLKRANVLSLRSLNRTSLQGQANVVPTDLLQALNIVVREHPARSLLPIGRSLFSDTLPASSLSPSFEILSGFTPSVRNTQQSLALNLDYTGAVVYKNIGVIEFLCDQDRRFKPTISLAPQIFENALHALRGLKVNVNHRKLNRPYTVRGLSSVSAEELRFRLDGGQETTIVAFFRQKYDLQLQYPKLPCLKMGAANEIYLPMEVCEIAPHQRYRKTLQRHTQNMICIPARERQNRIYNMMSEDFSPAKGDFVKEFGVKIDPRMTEVPARVLEPPELKYSTMNGQVRKLAPVDKGSWNLLSGVQCLQGCTILDWAIINFDSRNVDARVVSQFIWKFVRRCTDLGVDIREQPTTAPLHFSIEHLRNRNAILHHLRETKRACQSRLPLLFCIMADKHEAYGMLKKFADMDVGIVTQCCLTKHVQKSESQYLANVVLKVNAKLGGLNVELMQPIPELCPVLSDPTIIFGADVTHPKGGEEKPSIAAVVASTDWPSAGKYAARQSTQKGREEIIQNLGEMATELWQIFYRQTRSKPGKVLFFRDGVGEGQFEEVLRSELPVLKAALTAVGGEGYDPAVTMVLVQKRHHTRLFPQNMDREKNVAAGTVVDTTITHPINFDFFLCSHDGLIGTSKPCHYQLLKDEIGFSSDGIQALINRLCYTYARCARAVSYVPAAYYAHLAAFRARYYVDSDPHLWRPDTPGGILRLHQHVQDSMFFV